MKINRRKREELMLLLQGCIRDLKGTKSLSELPEWLEDAITEVETLVSEEEDDEAAGGEHGD
jgi:hypothetical protein